ncbi:Gut esterase 1 [Trichinella spiralis]|uniref:Para-nitrobenzyl esterase n=1 Tax=Trichinella spiralis TaxID=6334 RepID=E5SIS8_TRISP|nr:Gut esterase 1 [Trichinella spiralis]KRY34866.1 Para-nitrobenzyl esterase [Trichinella spiralis]
MKFLFTFFEPAHHVFIWYSSTILGILFLITVAQPTDQDHLNLVRRHTSYGDVLGFVHHGKLASAECYLGIPYARPPINDRRFAYPEPVDHWINLYNATYFRPWCVQFWYSDVYLEKREQSEDCLYLNIFVPRKTVHAKPYPVLVWIHGGSYQVGGSQLFPINGTVDNIVSHGVIFVSINYRLGPLVVDKYRENQSIIPLPAERLIRENARLPLMIGSTTGECIAYVSWLAYLAENDRIDLCNIEFVAPSFRFKNAEQVKQAIYQHYFDNRPIQHDTNLSHILVKIVTDQNIKVPMMKEISYYTNKNVPIFVYSFDYSDDKLQNMHLSFAMRDQGAAHGFDLVYLFQSMSVLDPRNITVEWASEDLNITYFIASTMTNFVKFGNPNFQKESNKLQFHWPPFDFPSSQQMYIGSQIKPIKVPFELLYFWNRTIEIIQTLSLQHDFIFEPPTVSNFHCGVFEDYELLNYRVAFFTVLTLSLAMLFLLGFCCFLHVNYRNQEKNIPTVVE